MEKDFFDGQVFNFIAELTKNQKYIETSVKVRKLKKTFLW